MNWWILGVTAIVEFWLLGSYVDCRKHGSLRKGDGLWGQCCIEGAREWRQEWEEVQLAAIRQERAEAFERDVRVQMEAITRLERGKHPKLGPIQ